MSGLTDKQQVWLEKYLECWNGAEAARHAGYAVPYQSAHDNITNPKVRQEIERRLALRAMSADEALDRLGDQARASVEDFIAFDPAGTGTWRIDLEKAKERGKLHLVKKLWYDSEGHLRLELHDAQTALELILRAHGAFKDNLELTGKDGKEIVFRVGNIDVENDV